MTDALRYEWLRIRSIRSTYWLTGLALAFCVVVSGVVSWAMVETFGTPQAPSEQDLREVGPWLGTQFARAGAPYFVAYLMAMVGILSWGHEYRHGMVRATLTALRSRTAVWVAKYLVAVVWVAVTVAVGYLLAVAVGWLFLNGRGVDLFNTVTYEGLGRAVLYAALLCALAMAFTGVIRNQTAALVLLFIWPLAVENIITLVFFIVPGLREHTELTRFLPFAAGGRIVDDNLFVAGVSLFGNPMSWVGGVVIFGGLAAVLMAASLVLFRNRDA